MIARSDPGWCASLRPQVRDDDWPRARAQVSLRLDRSSSRKAAHVLRTGAGRPCASPSLASLAAQVNALSAQLKQMSALSARQQQSISELKTSNAALVSRLGCVAQVSGTH